ncbi:hypothetical protein G6F63_015175 [Rhizopus arrhizus]|nr:hypothetical protein G6F63_015175 [Rhizopus arrhizus]
MILLGARINAETALRIGLAEEKVGKGEAKALALEWANKAGKQSPTSIAACKTLVQSTRSGTHASALVAEREAFVDLFDPADQVEGVTAFLEKRAAQGKNACAPTPLPMTHRGCSKSAGPATARASASPRSMRRVRSTVSRCRGRTCC